MKNSVLCTALLFLIGCKDLENNKTKEQTTSTSNELKVDSTGNKKQTSNWQYFDKSDEMTGAVKKFATNVSPTIAEFDFPYAGGSTFTLYVRKQGKNDEVFLTVDKGQFLISSSDNDQIRIKFDDEKPEYYSISGTTDYSSTTMFLGREKKLISKFKTCKKVMIEPEFYKSGKKIIEFNLEGFKWD